MKMNPPLGMIRLTVGLAMQIEFGYIVTKHYYA